MVLKKQTIARKRKPSICLRNTADGDMVMLLHIWKLVSLLDYIIDKNAYNVFRVRCQTNGCALGMLAL